jgi:hypothetical protein
VAVNGVLMNDIQTNQEFMLTCDSTTILKQNDLAKLRSSIKYIKVKTGSYEHEASGELTAHVSSGIVVAQTICGSDADCNDNSACTTDKCINGVCGHAQITCTPSDACHAYDGCDATTGCIYKSLPPTCLAPETVACGVAITASPAGCPGACTGTGTKCDVVGTICVNGVCQPKFCPQTMDVCPDGCKDLQTDPANCGDCGTVCVSGKCSQGVCACPAEQTDCAGACVDLLNDSDNCGTCGISCDSSQECVNGACSCLSQSAPYEPCDSATDMSRCLLVSGGTNITQSCLATSASCSYWTTIKTCSTSEVCYGSSCCTPAVCPVFVGTTIPIGSVCETGCGGTAGNCGKPCVTGSTCDPISHTCLTTVCLSTSSCTQENAALICNGGSCGSDGKCVCSLCDALGNDVTCAIDGDCGVDGSCVTSIKGGICSCDRTYEGCDAALPCGDQGTGTCICNEFGYCKCEIVVKEG